MSNIAIVRIDDLNHAYDKYKPFLVNVVGKQLMNKYEEDIKEAEYPIQIIMDMGVKIGTKAGERIEMGTHTLNQYNIAFQDDENIKKALLELYELFNTMRNDGENLTVIYNTDPNIPGSLFNLLEKEMKLRKSSVLKSEEITIGEESEESSESWSDIESESSDIEPQSPKLGTKTIILIIISVLAGVLIIPILVILGYLLYRTAVLPANRRWSAGKILKNAALWPLNLRGIAAY